jgi:DNA gyrase/topoisomerase IV subunit B
VYLNGELIQVNGFESYVSLYCLNSDCDEIEDEIEVEDQTGKKKPQKQLKMEHELRQQEKELLKKRQSTFCFDTIHTPTHSFQIAFIPNFNKHRQFEQVSFVNGVYTMKGGTHVNYIMDKLTKFLLPLVDKRDSKVCLNHCNSSDYVLFVADFLD